MVFLHEGLGSLSAWKEFPGRLCTALKCRGLVYSRPGYGRSTPRETGEQWGPDFMHRQADPVLPRFLEALGLDVSRDRPWLLGHSDGGSIALLYAALFPARVAGIIAVAPHLFVEDVAIESIRKARQAYLQSDLRLRLARHHDDPDSAFWGWNDIWLNPQFRAWSIEAELQGIVAPVLAVQGVDDEYGTLEQIRRLAVIVPHAQTLQIAGCGHSVQRDQPEILIEAVATFMASQPP